MSPLIFSASSAAAANGVRVGWIGTGIMGATMAGRLQKVGHPLGVFTRTPAKASSLVQGGARIFATPRELASDVDIVFSCVSYPRDVRAVLLHPETGALAGLGRGKCVVDMTTTEPSLAQEVAVAGARNGVAVLDAPVSGGDVGAKSGTLSIMVGCDDPAVFEVVAPVLQRLGTPRLMGPAGAGQATKTANQISIATSMIGMCEGMVFAARCGIDLEQYIEAIRGGGAGSKSIDLYAARILANDMAPGFFVEHFVKDLGIALRECERLQLTLPGLRLAHDLYDRVAAKDGGGSKGTQALIEVLAEINNVKI